MRFFNDGKVFFSFDYKSFPTIEQFNDFEYGKFGYYKIEKNEIIIELYQNRQYKVMFMFANPIPQGIQFYSSSYVMKPLFKFKDTDGGFYQKFNTKLYNWPE